MVRRRVVVFTHAQCALLDWPCPHTVSDSGPRAIYTIGVDSVERPLLQCVYMPLPLLAVVHRAHTHASCSVWPCPHNLLQTEQSRCRGVGGG